MEDNVSKKENSKNSYAREEKLSIHSFLSNINESELLKSLFLKKIQLNNESNLLLTMNEWKNKFENFLKEKID
jgi:hypothetical protein